MEPDHRFSISIPDDLDDVILQGMNQGKTRAAHRRRLKRTAACTACSFVLAAGLFLGGVYTSPTFAASVEQIPVLGQLVHIFHKNQPVVEGGIQAEGGTAAITMERTGSTELMRLTFQQTDAALYKAEFASYPKTITISLPGTRGVEVLSEISRAKDTSQYIKSVYQLPTSAEDITLIQLELECDADVQIEEYRDPGSLVVRLSPTAPQLDTIYSVRTLSFDAPSVQDALSPYAEQELRLLQDDHGYFFGELAQYPTRAEAEAASASFVGDVIVEMRTGNNVPVCFETMGSYESSQFLNEYYQLLISASSSEPVLDFLDQHFAQASAEEQSVMLKGLDGLLQDTDENADWARIASFYHLAGQELPEHIQQRLSDQK